MDDFESKVGDALAAPQNQGEMADADAVGTVGSPECGDMMRMWLKFTEKDGKKVIDRASFQAFGCQTAIAVASVATKLLQGKTAEEVQRMKADAQAMERAGACAIVLELVTAEAAAEVTAALQIPTIGIGAGKGTTGQIRVSYDLLGLTPWNRPGFVKEDLGFARQITEMVQGIRRGGRGELG